MIAWAEMAKCHIEYLEINEEYGDWECRGRADEAVDVMMIVGSVL